jgi:hypothetical protein
MSSGFVIGASRKNAGQVAERLLVLLVMNFAVMAVYSLLDERLLSART